MIRKQSYPKRARVQKKSLISELAEVLTKVHDIQKTKGGDAPFAYLRILDIANAVRDQLLTRGILLIPNDVNWWREAWTNQDGRVETQCFVETEFELTDGRRSRKWKSCGMGQSVDGYAMAIAQTMAIKAWLKRVGLIFGEWDDPERDHQSDYSRARFPREDIRLQEYRERALREACSTLGMTEEAALELLSQRFEETVTLDKLKRLATKKFDFAIQVLLGQRDLVADLSKSVEEITKANGKPQPIVTVLDRKARDEKHSTGD